MVKVLIDTNVLVDFVTPTRKNHIAARELFQMVLTNQLEGVISTQSILDAAYICRKEPTYNEKDFRRTIAMLLNRVNSEAIDPFIIRSAINNPDSDIEDNAMVSFAYDQVCNYIITNDKQLLSRPLPYPLMSLNTVDFVEMCKR